MTNTRFYNIPADIFERFLNMLCYDEHMGDVADSIGWICQQLEIPIEEAYPYGEFTWKFPWTDVSEWEE